MIVSSKTNDLQRAHLVASRWLETANRAAKLNSRRPIYPISPRFFVVEKICQNHLLVASSMFLSMIEISEDVTESRRQNNSHLSRLWSMRRLLLSARLKGLMEAHDLAAWGSCTGTIAELAFLHSLGQECNTNSLGE